MPCCYSCAHFDPTSEYLGNCFHPDSEGYQVDRKQRGCRSHIDWNTLGALPFEERVRLLQKRIDRSPRLAAAVAASRDRIAHETGEADWPRHLESWK